MNLNWRIRK